MRDPVDVLVVNATELLTCVGVRRGPGFADLEVLRNAAIAIADGKIVDVGASTDLETRYDAALRIDASGRLVTPSFVDAHTHLVHAGSRHDEWEQRATGIPRHGIDGGIRWSIARTREAHEEVLRAQAIINLDIALEHGTTVLEAKSGYGLDRETELRLLRIASSLQHPVKVVPTYLGAHVLPPEYVDDKDAYVTLVMDLLPEASRYARYCDVWVDPVAFTADDGRRISRAAQSHGMGVRLHADQTGPAGGSGLGAELGASSVDHLECISDADLCLLGDSNTVAIVLPGVTFHMTEQVPRMVDGIEQLAERPHMPSWCRRIINSGAIVALATDYNPGTCPTISMQMVMQAAARLYRMSYAEIWHAVTVNAAQALDRSHRNGSLVAGHDGDLIIWSVPEHGMVINRFGYNLVDQVLVGGQVVVAGARRVTW